MGKLWPPGTMLGSVSIATSYVTEPELSDIVGAGRANMTYGCVASVVRAWAFGHTKIGSSTSTTVTVIVHDPVLPEASVAV